MGLGLRTFKALMGSYAEHDYQFIIIYYFQRKEKRNRRQRAKSKEQRAKKITRSSFVCRFSAMKKHKRSRRHNEKEFLSYY